jgi:hypothetical protein
MAIKADAKPIIGWVWLARVHEMARAARMPERRFLERLCEYVPARRVRCKLTAQVRPGVDPMDPTLWPYAECDWAESRADLYTVPVPGRVSARVWIDEIYDVQIAEVESRSCSSSPHLLRCRSHCQNRCRRHRCRNRHRQS